MSPRRKFKSLDSMTEIEKQYSPSMWSKRFDPGKAEFVHLEVISKAYKNAIESFEVKKDVQYGETDGQKLDIFVGENNSKGSVIFAFIHGGYWQLLSKQQGGLIVEPLVSSGCTVATIGYDLAPKASMGTIVDQVQGAAKYILDFAKTNESRGVYFCGHSAGGHLAAMIATSSWLDNDTLSRKLIKGYISISGVFDLQPIIKTSVNFVLDISNYEARTNSPLFNCETIAENMSKECRFLVCVGENDSPEFIRQSFEFEKSLRGCNANTEFFLVKDVDHFDIIEKLNDRHFLLTQKILRFIESN